MNLPQFLRKVDAAVSSLSKEKLEVLLHNFARTVPEYERESFLEKLYAAGGENKRSIMHQEDQEDLQRELAGVQRELELIELGELSLIGNLNEEYDDWYGNEEEEFLFEDPENIAGGIEKACNLLHRCVDLEFFKEGYELADKLLALKVMIEGDYSDYGEEFLTLKDLEVNKLITINDRQLILDTLYAAYRSKPLKERPSALYQIILNSKDDVTLEALIQESKEELDQLDDFIELWIAYLGDCEGKEAERLLSEAITFIKDSKQALELTRKYSLQHPSLYEQILKTNLAGEDVRKQFDIGQEALLTIPPQYVVRSRIALLTAVYALYLDEQEEAEKCWLEAFRSDTEPIHYLRLVVESTDFSIYRERMANICEEVFKQPKKEGVSYYRFGELRENSMGRETYSILTFLNGEFERVITESMNVQEALGWSSTFMKCGMALFLLYLYEGSELAAGCKNMCNKVMESISFTTQEYKKGLIRSIDLDHCSLFWGCFCKWKKMTSMSEEVQEMVLKKLDSWIQMRVEGIMQNNRRNYYGECAAFIAALGEVKESRGEKYGREKLMESYKTAYSRRTAFHNELRMLGMKDRRK